MKLSNIAKIIVSENIKIDSDVQNSLKNLTDNLLNDKKFIGLAYDLLQNEPNIVSKLDSKFGKVISLDEELSSSKIDFSKIEKISSDLLKDIDIDINEIELLEANNILDKVIYKVVFLLGIRNTKVMTIVKYVISQYLQDLAANAADDQFTGGIAQYVVTAVTIISILLNLLKLLKNRNLLKKQTI
jgi:hypothetical protein